MMSRRSEGAGTGLASGFPPAHGVRHRTLTSSQSVKQGVRSPLVMPEGAVTREEMTRLFGTALRVR